MIDLSIILVNYNTRDLTLQCLKSIYENAPKNILFEIIIIDNASKEDLSGTLATVFPKVRFYKNNNNDGFGRANNRGAQLSSPSRFLLFLNTDTIIMNDVFSPIISFLNENQEVACVSPFIVYPDSSPQSTFGVFPTITSFLYSFTKLNKVFKSYYNEKYCYFNSKMPPDVLYVDQVVGVSMFVRKSVFNEVGGFDPDFFLYFEETELCYRIKQKKHKIAVYPHQKVIHLLNKSMPTSYFKMCNIEKGRMLYFKKTRGIIWYFASIISLIKHISYGVRCNCIRTSLKDFNLSFLFCFKL